jgi:hypothetical protein
MTLAIVSWNSNRFPTNMANVHVADLEYILRKLCRFRWEPEKVYVVSTNRMRGESEQLRENTQVR